MYLMYYYGNTVVLSIKTALIIIKFMFIKLILEY